MTAPKGIAVFFMRASVIWRELRLMVAEVLFYQAGWAAPPGPERDGMLLAAEAYFRERMK
jgi:hypothetical protein